MTVRHLPYAAGEIAVGHERGGGPGFAGSFCPANVSIECDHLGTGGEQQAKRELSDEPAPDDGNPVSDARTCQTNRVERD
jgi:hypothetical protein